MTQGRQASLQEEIREQERESWRCDPEKSFAEFTYRKVTQGEEVLYWFSETIEMRPYPNPIGFGGMWGGGGCRTKAELNKELSIFKKSVRRWQKHGLTKVVIRQGPDEERPDPKTYDIKTSSGRKGFSITAQKKIF